MVQKKVRVRFVPPPQGGLRLDSARAALVNRLFARKQSGEFILRLGDGDFEESLIKDLRWLKLQWEEGPDIGGSYGPYKQSSRKKTYHRYVQNLVRNDQAYPCYCTGEELAERAGKDFSPGIRLPYDKHCRELSTARRRELEKAGRRPVIRFKVSPRKIGVRDLLRGEMEWDTSAMEDFIILDSSGRPTPAFAAALDDSLMEVSHVIEDQDRLADLPERLLLFEALGFPVPRFAGMGRLLGPDRRPLRGEEEDSAAYYQREGCLPEGLINYLADPEGKTAAAKILNLKALAENFSLEELSSSPLVLDPEILDRVCGRSIRQADPERLTNLALPFLKRGGFLEKEVSEEKYLWVRKIVEWISGRINRLGEIKRFAPIFFPSPLPPETLQLREPGVKDLLEMVGDDLARSASSPESFWRKELKKAGEQTGWPEEKIFLYLGPALTGRSGDDSLPEILPLIPRELLRERIGKVLKKAD